MAFLLVHTTFADTETARNIASRLLEERLVACANLLPGVESCYHWKGKVETSAEVLVIFKTTGERYPELENRLKELHPYEVPEIIATPIRQGLPAYLDWIATETHPVDQSGDPA